MRKLVGVLESLVLLVIVRGIEISTPCSKRNISRKYRVHREHSIRSDVTNKATSPLFAAISAAMLAACVSETGASPVQASDTEIARFPAYTEGPAIDEGGNVFVSHHPFVSRVSPHGDVTIWAEIGRPNGHVIRPDGSHLICDENILQFSAVGEPIDVAASSCGPYVIRKANDIVLAKSGGFFFTDPGEAPEAYERPMGRVCYIDPQGTSYLVADGLRFPNGIVLVDGGKKLLVSETMTNSVLSIDIGAELNFGVPNTFATMPDIKPGQAAGPDGMATDGAGRVYVAHYGMSAVQVFDPSGVFLTSIPATANASNVAISKDGRSLYITGGVMPGYPAIGEGVLQKVSLIGQTIPSSSR